MSNGQESQRVAPGDAISSRELVDIRGGQVALPDREQLTHFQLRRFAGCPVCNLHLRSVVQRNDEITAAGIREVVVFHSTTEDLLRYEADLPFAVIADPDKKLYREFGVESAPRAVLSPRAWPAIIRGLARSIGATVRRRQPPPPAKPQGGSLGLPADILVASDGRVIARKYGEHAFDQWTVDELLAQVPARAAPA